MYYFLAAKEETVLKSEHDKRIAAKDAEYAAKDAEYAEVVEKYNQKCTSLTNDIKTLNASLKKEKNRNAVLESNASKLNNKILKLSKFKKSFTDTNATLVSVQASQTALKKECKAQVLRIAEQTETINTKDKEIAELNLECKGHVSRIAEQTETINTKDKEIAELNQRLSSKEKDIAELNKRLGLMEGTLLTMERLHMRLQTHEYKADVQAAAQKAVMNYIGSKRPRLE